MKINPKELGPAIIVAAVVLGPGSILTSSKVGAEVGFPAMAVLAGACVLMFGMVTMAARVGVIYERSPCGEIAARLGRLPSLLVGLSLFGIVAIFQSSNNLAIVAGLEPLLGDKLSPALSISFLLVINAAVVLTLYRSRRLYKQVERLMKWCILLMLAAFLVNLAFVLFNPPSFEKASSTGSSESTLLLLGLVGTTLSIGGAYYQAYLVKEKGWTLKDLKQGAFDSFVGVLVLCLMTAVVLTTSILIFHGRADAVSLSNVGEIARQIEPIFGSKSVIIFSVGILAGAFSSFLVNAIIGGTVMADSLGKGSKLSQAWPKHLSALALFIGMAVGIIAIIYGKGATVHLITFGQALTVIGLPILAFALLYLGSRPDLRDERATPKWMLLLVLIGTLAVIIMAGRTVQKIYQKRSPKPVASHLETEFIALAVDGSRFHTSTAH